MTRFGAICQTRKELNLQGFFATNSAGGDVAMPNAFAFPLKRGGWKEPKYEAFGDPRTFSCKSILVSTLTKPLSRKADEIFDRHRLGILEQI
jgi:hypothetical protein